MVMGMITFVSAEMVVPGVEIGDSLIYKSVDLEDGEVDGIEYSQVNVSDIVNTSEDRTVVEYVEYVSDSMTSWLFAGEEGSCDVLTNSSEIAVAITSNELVPSLVIKTNIKIGTLATDIATLLSTAYRESVSGTSINNTYGVRFKFDNGADNMTLEYIYNDNGLLLWVKISKISENDSDELQVSLITVNGVAPELESEDENGEGENGEDENGEDGGSNIPGYSYVTLISLGSIFLFLQQKNRDLTRF